MKKRRGLADQGLSRKSRTKSRPVLERFEDRLLMTIFVVTNTSDAQGATANDGSLRGAILASNASTTSLPNIIDFSLPSGLQTILPVAPLPTIAEPVIIDGSTASGYINKPLIEISGNNIQAGPGLSVNSSSVVIQDLIIDKFQGDGIDLNGVGDDNVDGCYIGVGPSGSALASNTGVGILIASPANYIGNSGPIGFSQSKPNVISGNNTGILITGSGATGNVIDNNFIGTNAAGTAALGNTNYGISVNTNGNTIGGAATIFTSGTNIISGNLAGIQVSGSGASKNAITGNYIGTDITGLLPIPNANDGIDITNSNKNTIGGTSAAQKNVISGNRGNGILISGATSTFNLVRGNNIGVGSNGTTPIGNVANGVVINGASNDIVGGTDLSGYSPQYMNIIANNGNLNPNFYGVEILGGTGDGVLSNSIYNNGGIGIKLNKANAGIAPPTLTLSESGAGQSKIVGTYTGAPNEPYLIQFFSSQTPNSSGSGDGQNYLGDLSVMTNKQGFVSFTALLNQTIPVGYSVSSTATDNAQIVNNTSQFSGNVVNVQAPVTDLQVTTSVPSGPPLFDQPYTYTVTVTNSGPNDDTDVVLTDILPTTATFVSASAGTVSAGVLTDIIGSLADGASVVVTITVKPNAVNGDFQNTASVTGDGLDPDLTNNSVTTTGTVLADSDLAVIITPSETTAPIGSPITYAITVSNFGPNVANGTVTTVTLPADFTAITVTPDQGTYSIDANNNITINTGLLGVSSSSTVLIMATPENTGSAVVTASVTSSLTDPNPANNTTTNTVNVANAADLGVGLDASPSPVLVGNELIYTISLFNNGPSAASEPVVTDILPAGLTFVPGDSSAGPNGTLSFSGGTVTAAMNALLAGDTDTITIAVIPNVSGPINNTVTVGDPTLANSVEIDANPDNNTASTTVLVSPVDLSVTVLNPNDPLFINNQAVYQIQITNAGPADATNVLLTDVLGAGATILDTSAGTISGSTVSANLGTLASGDTETVTIAVNPTISGILLDSATVTSDDYDSDPSNNSSSSSNLVSPVDLSVSATASESSLLIGQPLTYTITVTNAGPATSTNVIFTDALPSGVTIGSFTTSQGTLVSGGTTISGNIGDLASGASATITITVTPTTVESAVNTASVTSDDYDTDPSNNSVTTTVNAFNLPGSVAFSSNIEFIPENAGSITLTINRTGGSLGAVTVDYATSDYTAIAGVNYVASAGTVAFADGQTTATITIPVLDDGSVDGNYGFFVTLSNATGGASLGAQTTSAVLVTNTDRDTIPPVVSSLIAIPNGSSLNGFIVTFDKSMDLARVSDVTNYHIYVIGTNGSQTPVPLAGVVYNPATDAVTVVPTSPLPANRFYRVLINGSFGDALTDTSGNILYGSAGLGTNYDVFYGQGTNLTYDDALGNKVNIKITGGGSLGVYLASNGNAEVVNIYGVNPGKTRLSGSVTKLSKHASGYTTIGFINGFGQFGNVFSTLTTPSFYVGSAPVSIASVAASNDNNTVNALATTPTKVHKTVTPKSKTPKAPKVKMV